MKGMRFLLLAALSIIAVHACKKENQDAGGSTPADGGPIKATWTAYTGGPQQAWKAGDELAVFSGGNKAVLKATTSGATSTFDGNAGSSPYYAIVPASAASSAIGSVISATVPDTQTAVTEGISAKSSIAVAASSSSTLVLRNVLGLLKFTLASDYEIKSVAVESKGNENLAGDVTIDATKATTSVISGKNRVLLTAEGTGKMDKGIYYTAVLPATYIDGFSITLTDKEGRVAKVSTPDFLVVKASQVLDLGTIDKDVTFSTPVISASPYELGFSGNGETRSVTVSLAFSAISSTQKPDWITIERSGKSVQLTAAGNSDTNARYGKVVIEGSTEEGPGCLTIPVAQAANGMKIVFDSFTGTELNSNWKGNKNRAEAAYGDGYLTLSGTGDDRNAYPLFWHGDRVRLKYGTDSYNNWICTVDCSSGSAGLWLFSTHGYLNDTYDFFSSSVGQNYRAYLPFAWSEGETTGGFYCFGVNSANAQDNWESIKERALSPWLRLELTNLNRNSERPVDERLEHEIEPNWAACHIYSLTEEENGTLVKDQLLYSKELWWFDDAPLLGTEYSYFGVFTKDAGPTNFRNFTLQFTDRN